MSSLRPSPEQETEKEMANRRKSMQKVREILRLKELKMSVRAIARAVNVSRPTVNDYLTRCESAGLAHEEATRLGDADFLARIAKPEVASDRYTTLSEKFAEYARELKRVGVTLYLLWKEYTIEHPDGYSYQQFCRHFREWNGRTELSMHFEHKAGDKMFVDFAGQKMDIVDPITGEIREVEIFVAVLGASGLTYALAVESQKKADWILANTNAFYYFGGVTCAVVPDNLKSAVTKTDRYEPDLNPEYFDFAEHHGTVILPARAGKPKDKSLVENAVKLVYQRVFAPLRDETFHGLVALNQAIIERLAEHNDRPMQVSGMSRRQLFDATEQAHLRPLPTERYRIKEFQGPTTIQKNYHVFLKADGHYYSVPYRHRLSGGKVVLLYTEKRVEIFLKGIRIAGHERDRRLKRYTTSREHMPPAHAAVSDWRPDEFLRKARKVGVDVERLVGELLRGSEHPEQAYRSIMGVLSLQHRYGDHRLNRACRRALHFGETRYKAVRNILEHGLDKLDEEQLDLVLPAHENIRGKDYYENNNDNNGGNNDERSDTGETEFDETAGHEPVLSGDAGDGRHGRDDRGRTSGDSGRRGMGMATGEQAEPSGAQRPLSLPGLTGRNQLSLEAQS